MEVSGALVKNIGRGNGISLSCAVLGDACISEIFKPPGDLALQNVKCNEDSRCARSFQSAFVGLSDNQVSSKVDSITDDSKFEKPVRKKKKNNTNRSYSSKKISDKIVSTTGESKYDVSDAKPSSPSIKEDIISPAMNSEKCLENYTPLVHSTSLYEIKVKRCSEYPNIHNCKPRTCCKRPAENKQGCEVCNSSQAIRERNGFKCHNLASELDVFNNNRNPHIMTGKENSHSVWQKRRTRETQKTHSSQHAFSHGASCLHSSSDFSAHGQPTRACSTNFTVPVKCGFQPYHEVKLPGMNHVSARAFCASTNSESYMTFKQFNEHQFRKDVTSGMNAKKWSSVGTKASSISEKTGSAGICHVRNGDLPISLEGENDGHSSRNIIDYHASAMFSKSKGTNLIGGHSVNAVKTEDPNSDSQSSTTEVHHAASTEVKMEYVQNLKYVQQLIIGLKMVTDPVNAAYKMQLVSEGFEIVTGCPLAEFERFLHSAAPAIASSYLHAKCSVCLGDQLSNSSLCKHQMPKTLLLDVWKWYEEPGSYGLKVKAGDSQYLNGLLTETTSFHAHFVPYLSAVRLFGYSHLSNSYGTSEECSCPDMHIRNSSTALEGQHLLAPVLKFGSIDEHVNSYKDFCSRDPSQSFIPSPACSSNCELVFEFFETEKPWLRKPLHKKIVDLIDAEASNLRGFGDPSKLKSLKLNDLHPASWFSVAWYPIYRIPEGKFGAAFLTYHSLGHLVLRDVPTDSLKKKTLSVVSPVVGLLSYKAQAEHWFDLKIPVESSFKQSSFFNRSEILREQLKILAENASLFARGCVRIDGTTVLNRHQDYGFFSSRK